MKTVRDYKFVYENWYIVECSKRQQRPMLLSEYFRSVPLQEIVDLKKDLLQGTMPLARKGANRGKDRNAKIKIRMESFG